MSVAIGSKRHMNLHIVKFVSAICVLSSSIYFELWQFSDFDSGHFLKFKMAARYLVGSNWYLASYQTIYHNVYVCQFSCFCHKYILRYAGL